MSIKEVSPEQLARLFHHYREALAPDFGCAAASGFESWGEVPPNERGRMVAAARLALLELDSAVPEPDCFQRYFAKPGEAEWGC